MPPPVVRQTLTSASRASIADEKKRQEKVAHEIYQRSKVCGTIVFRLDATQDVNALQKEKGNKNEGKRKSREVGRRLAETRITNEPANRMREKYDPSKCWDNSDLSGGAMGTSASRGMSPTNHNGGSITHGKDITGRSGQSSGATATSSRGLPPSLKIQYSTASVTDPYGYTRISASERRLYSDNWNFYRNKIYSKPPPGHTIEEMLKWKGDYGMLERNHRYIQWLFPIPEGNGLNMYAQQLFEHEAQAIRDDDSASERVLKAYKMMLDFYGMQLACSIQGTVKRSSKGWIDRYDHLNRSRHNLLRITRILKSLGELGYERLQAPWVDFLIEEAVVKKELPNLNGSCLMHWVMAVKDDGEREVLFRKANGLPINQDNADMDNIGSESEDEDKEGEEMQNQNNAEMPSQTPETGANQQATKDAEVLKHIDKATAMFKQTKVAESVNAASVSKQKGDKPDEKQIKDNSEASRAKTMDKSTKSAEFVNSAPASVSKQKHEIPNEKSMKDKTVQTTNAGMKSTVTGETASGKQSTGESFQRSDNLKFYQNIILSRPASGFTIETILKHKGNYKFFDDYPGFIQWLFPVPESTGRNAEAQPLYEHEAKGIRDDDELSSRVLEAFKVMLDFYGMWLCDEVKGKFKRIKETYKERYEYLQRYTVNYMRITRILISIGELGLDRFQCPWIDFLISEGIDNALFPTLGGHSIKHWISAIKDEGEKHAMFLKYQKLAGHKALIADTEEDMEVSNDVYIAHNTEYSTNADVDYARAEGYWGYDSLDFV
ncbi:uncharacterized protein LOC128550303 isoform X2 [Mercenaria mercenaria]|uniref:uncharacterized protein LOC128550303 isoform X2 n=1 Tax=Mercenaria mercenaria TaxID=6596 RepID=UPI00234E6F67|nr:uncharacterized protein LOC128550303 isoform X2 [Mercenaria mercenaria]